MTRRPFVRSFAGIIDARGVDDGDLGSLTRVLRDDGDVDTFREGSLALAWTGAPPHIEGGVVTFIDGDIFNLDQLDDDGAGEPAARLARLHRHHGDDVFARLRGDFAALIFDTKAQQGVLLRDQLGSRSAVWSQSGERMRFAAEVQHMLTMLDRRPNPDPVALGHWLSVSGLPPGHTFYEGIHRVDPGHLVRFGRGRTTTSHRYWSPVYRRPDPVDADTAAAGLRTVLTEAVRRRCAPDTAVLLSGGLDSSTVAAMSSTLAPGLRVRRAYSAVFPDHPSVDESDKIALLCRTFGLASTTAVVRGGSALSGAAAYIERWSIPPASPNLFFWLPLFRQARADGMLRMLDGEGGDEILGFSPALIADRVRRLRLRAAADLVRRIPGGGPHLTRRQVMPYVRTLGLKGAVPAWAHQLVRRVRGSGTYVPDWVGPAAARAFTASDQTVVWKRIGGPRWWGFMVDATTRNMGPAYGYDHVRRRNQGCGIEPSHPLSDVDVIEYMLSLPPELSYDSRYSRPLARQAVAGLTPDEVRLRPSKSFFNATFEGALVGVDLAPLRRLLGPGALVSELVDPAGVAALLDDPPPDGQRGFWAVGLWRMATLEFWLHAQAGDLVSTVEALRLDPADVVLSSQS